MAYTRTFAQLSLAVQQLGGWEGSSDITPAVLLQAINYGLIEGYRAMVNAWRDYYTLQADFAIVAGMDTYALATIAPNFFELRHLDVSSDGVRFRPCPPHDIAAAHRWSAVPSTTVSRLRYRMQGANLRFVPVPPAATGRIYYIPLAPQFVSTADPAALTFDVPSEELLVVAYAYRESLFRSELDPSPGDKKIGEAIAGLRTDAGNRDAGEPLYLDPAGPRRDPIALGWDDDWT
jgi:hypothetical protein